MQQQQHQQTTTTLLTLFQGAVLLTADCLGTGLLALPYDLNVALGLSWGIVLLLFQFPLNLYAGTVLHQAATIVEEKEIRRNNNDDARTITTSTATTTAATAISSSSKKTTKGYDSINIIQEYEVEDQVVVEDHHHTNNDQYTFDFIGMTQALFGNDNDDEIDNNNKNNNKTTTTTVRIVMIIYYTNIFLVLGDYILVMSHAVVAMVGGNMCLPTAGLLASTLMFAVAQLRTMAKLGRTASFVSLGALLIVVIQCMVALKSSSSTNTTDDDDDIPILLSPSSSSIFSKFSGMAAIGFAVGSQKLFLNIRHEMHHRHESPQALGYSLTFYVSAYVIMCIIAGPNPPSFLFDALGKGLWSRQLGGLLLWIHVVVSYAINSQAICSSMDRLVLQPRFPNMSPTNRWMSITLLTSLSAFVVANAIPFFTDLVALIGALTSIPLTLLLPVVLYRKATITTTTTTVWFPDGSWSYLVLVVSILYTIIGLIGAIVEIDMDWSHQGTAFSCT